ncbi:putative lipoprotein [Pseudomonas chlororaphis]|uniref:Putative lipoprotein n=2 Tax=Pseudomonas chlororaphis TaxID=587753 RepID=A0A3G7TWG1_9PSED|nr:putative lipoprotein [Pseudomonas chlororaphis]
MKSSGMPHALLALLMLVALPLWAAEPRDLAWSEMIPPDAPAEVPNMKPLHDLSQMSDALAAESAPAARQEMPNAPVVQSLDGLSVRLPGYIVPLEVSEEGRTTEFLLVPYFGACIHVPPPPSNQIVHVKSQVGVKLDELYQPYWIEGPMQVKASTSEIADAGYQMEAQKIYVYELQE